MAQPPVQRSLSESLDDDTIGAFLSQCSVTALRSLNSVSRTWRERVRTALRARVRESDHSLTIDGLSWTELDWLLRALQRDGVRVEQLRCEQATISFAPLLAALRDVKYDGWSEIFMHPVPRGVPILDSTEKITAEINRSRKYLAERLGSI